MDFGETCIKGDLALTLMPNLIAPITYARAVDVAGCRIPSYVGIRLQTETKQEDICF